MTAGVTPSEAAAGYARRLARSGYAPGSAAQYARAVRGFCAWLEQRGEDYAGALDDEHARDWAVRDYKRELQEGQHRSIATVESHLSAIFSFYDYIGLGKPRVQRQSPPKSNPKGLATKELRRVMRECERRGPRENALGALLFGCAVRVGEAAQLDTDDVFVTDRQGILSIRYGKGGQQRQVPIPADARPRLRPWLAQRQRDLHEARQPAGPLFTSRSGGRLSKRRMQSLLADIGASAGVELSPHMLRHTFAQQFLASGGTIGQLQEILGHQSLSSTQVYLRPSRDQLAEAADRVRIEP